MSVYKKNNRWYFNFQIRGKRYHRAVPEATTKKMAEQAEAKVKAELLGGRYDLVEFKKQETFFALGERFEQYVRSNCKGYINDLSALKKLKEFFGDKKLKEFTPFIIEQYRQYRKKLGMKGATINREIGVLRRMMTMAENYGWINYNPAVKRYIKPLKVENKKIKILDKQEVATLLKCCYVECEFLKPIFLCALHTGMRKSEILQLEWENVDIEQQLITILKQKNGKKSEIPISSPLLLEFKKLKLQKSSKYVFVNPLTNAPYVNIRYSIQKVFKRAGLENFTFHGLRHTACTRLIELNVPLDVVKDIMRHSNINITLDVYNHIKQERKREAIELLSNY